MLQTRCPFLSYMLLCVISFFIPLSRAQSTPKGAQNFIDQLPNKKLSVEFVLQKAIDSSSSFKQIAAALPAADAPVYQSEASLDWMLKGQALYMENFSQVANNSFPTFPHRTQYEIGINKGLSTGTQLGVGWELSEQKMNFAGLPRIEYKESKLKAEINQNLWKNAFGSSQRKNLQAAQKQSQANKLMILKNMEDFSLGIVQIYYQAWLEQQDTLAAQKNLQRKKLLLKSALAKFKRGTAERPDKIQIEGAVKAAEVQWLRKQQQLQQTWQSLVVSLDLPREWLIIEAEKIPLSMPSIAQATACAKAEGTQITYPKTTAALAAENSAMAAKELRESAKASAHPDISLFASLASNALEKDYSKSIKESAGFAHLEWMTGVRFSMPLGFKEDKALVKSALSQEIAASAYFQREVEQTEIDYRNFCGLFNTLKKSQSILKNNLEDQIIRTRLEQERFDLGRSSMLNVIQASDDAAIAEYQLKEVEASLQLTWWQLERLEGKIGQKFSSYVEREAL